MFSQLKALAAKPTPKPTVAKPPPQQQQQTPAPTTAATIDPQQLPLRRDRTEDEVEGNKRNDNGENSPNKTKTQSDNEEEQSENEILESSSPYQNKYAMMTSAQEKSLVQDLRAKISAGESMLNEKLSNQAASTEAVVVEEANASATNKKTPESRRKDDILLTWVNLELTRWHFDLVAKKRQIDPLDVDGLDKCIEVLKKFVDYTLEEIQPMIDGLENHLLPIELTDALFNAFTACHVHHRFNEAENIYFQYLLGNSNWHLGVFTMLHQRAAHDSFLRGNIKSKLHNHELRKMMVVFKELMNREQYRVEEEKKRKQ